MRKMLSIFIISVLLTLLSGQCFALDPQYVPQPNYNKSDFDRAMESASKNANQPPAYTPPNPHDGRFQVPNTDYSVGGSANPPSVNVRTTTNIGE